MTPSLQVVAATSIIRESTTNTLNNPLMEKEQNITHASAKAYDVKDIVNDLLRKSKVYSCILVAVFLLSSAYILCIPRTYKCEVELAPELNGELNSGGLSSIMNTIGLGGLGSMNSDAIYPYLYPDLMQTREFIVQLFDVEVETIDGSVKTDYYTYLTKYNKAPWWSSAVNYMKKLLKPKSNAADSASSKVKRPVYLTKEEVAIVEAVSANVHCTIDKKTNVISISVIDQDALVCATMADTIMTRLQNHITNYRTKKARNDVEYSEAIYKDAKQEYDQALAALSQYSGSHYDLVSESAKNQKQKLENEVSLKLNNLSSASTQLQLAKAKLQENTPAFTMLQGPYVPSRPSAPRRMLFVLGCVIAAALCEILYSSRKYIY